MTDLTNKLLRLAEYSFTDIGYDWGQLTEKEREILSAEDMEEIKRLVDKMHQTFPAMDEAEKALRLPEGE